MTGHSAGDIIRNCGIIILQDFKIISDRDYRSFLLLQFYKLIYKGTISNLLIHIVDTHDRHYILGAYSTCKSYLHYISLCICILIAIKPS